jgi:phospholipid/cholesterol/gamma-HCH transport system permease protein
MRSEAAKDASAAREPDYRISRRGNVLNLALTGSWVTRDAVRLNRSLHALDMGDAAEIEIDGGKLERLDSAGAWLVLRTKRVAEHEGKRVQLRAMPESFALLVKTLDDAPTDRPARRAHQDGLTHLLERTGRGVFDIGGQALAMLGYLGLVAVEGSETVVNKRRFRLLSLIAQIEETGLTALPILGLLSFLLGIVIAYQGVDQLTRFGAQIFTVNLVGVSILREIAALIAAIIVAGRSGSAFTAQIGTMKVNQEIDALETMGVNVVEILVLPRILGLMIALPLLTVFADAMGLLGGATMCYFDLGIGFPAFLHQLHGAISLNTFLVGLLKAPVFAFLIAFVGCFEGLRVESNAASLGRLTTRSVVESIFLVIVCDAGFSILFSLLGV